MGGSVSKKQLVEDTPTTILTQMGVTSCLPKLARGETAPSYTKRHEKKTK